MYCSFDFKEQENLKCFVFIFASQSLPMNIDLKQLEINVNFHALQPDFLNLELHYIVAENENIFRFVNWNELPKGNEQKFYCFLKEKEIFIPAGNVVLKESYVVTQEPIYPLVSDCKDFISVFETVQKNKVAKGIRRFSNEELETIKDDLQKEFETVETHVVASPELQHHIFVVNDIEVSVAPTMVYFRIKAPFAESHYQHAKEE